MTARGAAITKDFDTKKPSSGMRRSLFLVALLLIGGLVWFFVWGKNSTFRWDLFWSTFSQTNPYWLAAAVGIILLTYLGRAIRWQVMIRPICPKSSLWNLFDATVIGFTAVVLFGRAGELVRPYLIANKEKVSFTSQIAVWLLERIYDLLSVLMLFGFALSQISASSTKVTGTMEFILKVGGHSAGILATICLAVLITFGLFPAFVEKRLNSVIGVLPARFEERLTIFVKAFLSGTSSTRRGSFVLQLVLYTFCEWMLIVGCFVCVFRAFPLTEQLGLLDSLIIVGFVAFGSAVQVPGIGGGMQVATVLVLTELFHLPVEGATGIAILLWVITFLLIVPIGLLFALKDGLRWRKLMHIKEIESL